MQAKIKSFVFTAKSSYKRDITTKSICYITMASQRPMLRMMMKIL
jgi:hypothetical protein